MWIDTHAHIEGAEFDSDREAVATRAFEAGVQSWINISNGLDSLKKSFELAEKYPSVSVSVGLHPHEANEATPEILEKLAQSIHHPKVVALGETGLDYYYENSPKKAQQELLHFFLKLAKKSGLPLSIHMRDAEEDFLAAVNEIFPDQVKGVIHCFTSNWGFAQACLKKGFYISFSGIVTFKKAKEVQEVAQKVPLEKLLVETDAPFLAPEPFRGKRNEPAYLVKTAEFIAGLRAIELKELAQATTENAKKLFGLK